MIRYISLLLFIGLAFWSCEEEAEPAQTQFDGTWSGQTDQNHNIFFEIENNHIREYFINYSMSEGDSCEDSTTSGLQTIMFAGIPINNSSFYHSESGNVLTSNGFYIKKSIFLGTFFTNDSVTGLFQISKDSCASDSIYWNASKDV